MTHLMIHMGILEKWLNESFTVGEQRLVRESLQNNARLLFFKNGEEVDRVIGLSTKETLMSKVDDLTD